MRYFLYARKSTEEDDRQILSIEAQLHELREFATKERLEIVASFTEAKTAKEPGRTKFGEMLDQIERGKADGIVCWHPDRLARNSVDGGRIIHLVDRGLIQALKFPQFWFEPTPQGLFMLNIAFGQSKYFVDNLRENTKRGLRQKIRNGVWPGWAPVGYLNNPRTRGIDVNAEKAPKVARLFELYATGGYPLHTLAKWCQEHQLTTNKNQPISISNVQHILKNVFYVGLMRFNGEIYEGTHQPLVSKKLFDRVQAVLRQRGKGRPQEKHAFAFLNFLRCRSCGCAITAETQKGHTYYRCTKKKGVCEEKRYLREERLVEQIKESLRTIALSSQDTEKVLFELEKDERQAKEQSEAAVQNLRVKIVEIENQLEKLLDAYLAQVITGDEYSAKKSKLLTEKLDLNEQIANFEQRGVTWLEPAREFVLNLNQAETLRKSEDFTTFPTFLKKIGSNHVLRRGRWDFVFTPTYKLAVRPAAVGPKRLINSNWCRGWVSNPHAFWADDFKSSAYTIPPPRPDSLMIL